MPEETRTSAATAARKEKAHQRQIDAAIELLTADGYQIRLPRRRKRRIAGSLVAADITLIVQTDQGPVTARPPFDLLPNAPAFITGLDMRFDGELIFSMPLHQHGQSRVHTVCSQINSDLVDEMEL
jgi:hypothetical protein